MGRFNRLRSLTLVLLHVALLVGCRSTEVPDGGGTEILDQTAAAAALDSPPTDASSIGSNHSEKEGIHVAANYTHATGPLVDILGSQLLHMEMVDDKHATLRPIFTTEALQKKNVVGIYFSADWCPACVQFTPELVQFYTKVNKRRGDDFAIVWVSRCRSIDAYSQYMTSIPGFFALPPEEAMGQRGEKLMQKYGVKGIPSLILLDESGSIITKEGRTMVPKDRAGIGFPWRNPLATLYITLVPRRLRVLIKEHVGAAKENVKTKVQGLFRPKQNAKVSM